MSLIDSFTKPQWQHRKPEVRIAAIDQLDDQAVLLDLVSSDPDAEVRAHALSRVRDGEKLDQLVETLPQPLQQQARAQRLQQLLPDRAALASINDDSVLVRIASLTDEPDLITASIGQIGNQNTRVELAGAHPAAKVRLSAAQGISEIDLLQQLAQQSKHKDKAVYRYCKEQLDKNHAKETAETERQAKIGQLTEAAVKLSQTAYSPEYKGRYLSLSQKWQALKDQVTPAQHETIQNALDTCAGRVQKRIDAHAADEQQQAVVSAAQQSFPDLIAELEELDRSTTPPEDSASISKLNNELNGIEDRWLAALHQAKASAEQTEQCKKHLRQWRAMAQTSQRLLERKSQLEKIQTDSEKIDKSDFLALHKLQEQCRKLISALPWPESHATITPRPIQALHEHVARLEERLAKLKEKEKQNLKKMQEGFEELHKELDDNHFKNADRALNKLRQVLRKLDHKHQQHYQHELRPLIARLSEIHDWQGFAIEPKKIELCEQMKALVGSEEDADILAGKIKALQIEWKKLGALSPRRDQALWKKFSSAADEAWKPCKQAFAEQADLCQKNLEQRIQLVSQLVVYEKKMHWPDAQEPDAQEPDEESSSPDWKLVQKTLDTAREAFRNIKPVDRKGERKSQKKLRAVCDKIYAHVRQEYDRNIKLKEAMIGRAQELVELEDLRQAIDQAKRIQREWKEIGMTPMRVDRKLWKDFRGACDAVFARLDQQREQQKAEMSTQIEQANGLLEQARTLLDSDDKQRLHLKRDLTALRSELHGIDLPRSVQQQLVKKLADMEREANSIVRDIRARQEKDRWQHLLQRMKACSLKVLDEKQALTLWEQDSDIPKGIETAALDDYWQQGPGEIPDAEQQEACIALEIHIGIDSPPEDKDARMAYQMKRLVEGMGSGQTDDAQRLLELINEFIVMRPSSERLERFSQGLEKAVPESR
jgi:exonuclease SbcC